MGVAIRRAQLVTARQSGLLTSAAQHIPDWRRDHHCEGVSEPSIGLCVKMYTNEHTMTETLSVRIDARTKKRLDVLARRSKRSKSFLAAEAITAYVESEEWQLGEIQAALAELDAGHEVSHERVAKWLNSWGKSAETKAPR
jgi:predicted transcriptional regulator